MKRSVTTLKLKADIICDPDHMAKVAVYLTSGECPTLAEFSLRLLVKDYISVAETREELSWLIRDLQNYTRKLENAVKQFEE